jgi:serine/threonine protein kinase
LSVCLLVCLLFFCLFVYCLLLFVYCLFIGASSILFASVDKAVDMWAMGVILYILICGYPPFSNRDPNKVKRMIIAGDFQFHPSRWRDASEEVRDLVASLLRVDVGQRLTVEGALNHRWLNASDEKLYSRSLSSFAGLAEYQANKRRLKKGLNVITAIHYMQSKAKETRERKDRESGSLSPLRSNFSINTISTVDSSSTVSPLSTSNSTKKANFLVVDEDTCKEKAEEISSESHSPKRSPLVGSELRSSFYSSPCSEKFGHSKNVSFFSALQEFDLKEHLLFSPLNEDEPVISETENPIQKEK